MSDYIRSSVTSIGRFFAGDRALQLPWFQRAYAWNEDNVIRLITDVIAAMEADKRGYSLGQIHLAAVEGAAHASLIDGHQRAITLAVILAILRDLADAEESDAGSPFHELLLQSSARDDRERRHAARWRLTSQQLMAEFFEAHVQTRGSTVLDPEIDLANLSPAERNLLLNRDRLRATLAPPAMSREQRRRFADFLLNRCFMVVIEVDDEDDAWSMLGIEQSTRLPHNPDEQAKITLIYTMPAAQQDEAGLAWEAAQSLLEPDLMADLLFQLRTLKLDKRSTKPLECDLQRLYALNEAGLGFVNTILMPAAEAVKRIAERSIDAGTDSERTQIKAHLDALHLLDNRLWVAPAIAWMTKVGHNDPDSVAFFFKLQRLAWALRVAGTDPSEQETRFIKLTKAVKAGTLTGPWAEFEVSEKTRRDALANLRSRTFYLKHYCTPVLHLLSFFGGGDPGQLKSKSTSIEHILPRRPPKERNWIRDFAPHGGVSNFTDRLGNLSLLSFHENLSAGTNDWPIKRAILSASEHPLSQHAGHQPVWTAAAIEARTEQLIKILFAKWDLKITPA